MVTALFIYSPACSAAALTTVPVSRPDVLLTCMVLHSSVKEVAEATRKGDLSHVQLL